MVVGSELHPTLKLGPPENHFLIMLFTALGGAILQPIYEVHPQETLLYSVNCVMFYSNYPGNVGLSGEVGITSRKSDRMRPNDLKVFLRYSDFLTFRANALRKTLNNFDCPSIYHTQTEYYCTM